VAVIVPDNARLNVHRRSQSKAPFIHPRVTVPFIAARISVSFALLIPTVAGCFGLERNVLAVVAGRTDRRENLFQRQFGVCNKKLVVESRTLIPTWTNVALTLVLGRHAVFDWALALPWPGNKGSLFTSGF